ncbi:transglutaminase-like domain-containing protein [Thermovibrio ammonificans]
MRKFLAILAAVLTAQSAFGAVYRLTETVDLKPQPDARLVELWIPVPYQNRWQKLKELKVEAPEGFTLKKGEEYGNSYLYLRWEGPLKRPVRVRVTAVVERSEVSPTKRGCPVPLRYYLSDRLVPVEKFKELARQITAGKKTDLEKLRAIYNYVVTHMKYDKSGKGWGRGDAVWACDAKRGNCTDFHSLFIALCRAVGIPAVFEIGIPVNRSGLVKGYHCWVLAFPKGYVYGIDASEAAKNPRKRDYYFGHLDDHRIGMTRGRDLLLNPPQHGDRLNYMYKAYEEVDLHPAPTGVKTYFFVEKLR